MDKSAFINNVYQKLCDAFVSGCDFENEEEVIQAYLRYLHKQYDRYFDEVTETEFNKIAVFCVKKEKITNLSKNQDEKIAIVFPDINYLALEDLCFEIVGLARRKKGGDLNFLPTTQNQYNEYIERLDALFNLISPRFKYTAEKILSEALVELDYIFSEFSETSFRMHSF